MVRGRRGNASGIGYYFYADAKKRDAPWGKPNARHVEYAAREQLMELVL
jgi:hypothetical protein